MTPQSSDRGFIMVALLIGMAVAAVWMGALLPAWRQQTQRQLEDDLVFRGEQYARAIALFTQKNDGRLPSTIDELVQQRYLRKKWKDPITGEDFQLFTGATTQQGGAENSAPSATQPSSVPLAGGIRGVYSSSTDPSIRIYNNAQQYNQWIFDYQVALLRMGRSPAGQGGERGGRGGEGRGGRGGDRGRGGTSVGGGDGRGGADAGGGRRGNRGGGGNRGGRGGG